MVVLHRRAAAGDRRGHPDLPLMAVARLPGDRPRGESAVIALGSLGLLP
jgi:hypothetical protein